MKSPLTTSLFLGMLMVSSGFLTMLLTPTPASPDHLARINLETLIATEFDGWKVDLSNAYMVINPETEDMLAKIYNQTLARTYINRDGERVMLSIAYGGAQKSDLHAHRPEICYTAGGFEISSMYKTMVDTSLGRIPAMRLVAKQDARTEPITYWIRVGDDITRGWFEQKFTSIRYGLTGKVPDGILVRVSSISANEQASYGLQQSFLAAMLQAMRSEDRHWLIGRQVP